MVKEAPPKIEEIAEQYMRGVARVDPYGAVRDLLDTDSILATDYSAAGVAARLGFARETLEQLGNARPQTRRETVTAVWLTEIVDGEIALWGEEHHTPMLRLVDGPIVDVISVFRRVLSRDPIAWHEVRVRLSQAPRAIASMQANLVEGLAQGAVATRRQAELFAEYCEDSGGQRGRGVLDWLLARVNVPAELQNETAELVSAVHVALLELADFVTRVYVPATNPTASIGTDRYQRRLRYYTGTELDPIELYEKTWSRFRSTMKRLRDVARDIDGDDDVHKAIWLLESQANEMLRGDRELCLWLQAQIDEIHDFVAGEFLPAIDGHSGFDVRLARGEARSALQSADSESGEPSVIWVKETGEIAIPKWRYLSLCHAVVVPGSWYQRNRWLAAEAPITRAQKLIYDRSSYAGWGHYATQLLDMLGYYETPSAQISYLQRELLQSVRVLVDIGYNLSLRVPSDSEICAGELWSEATGTQFIAYAAFMSRQQAAGEMRRAISCAGQFPSYRVLSDVIVDSRARAKVGVDPEGRLRQFHDELLNLGPLGASDLETQLSRLPMLTDGSSAGRR